MTEISKEQITKRLRKFRDSYSADMKMRGWDSSDVVREDIEMFDSLLAALAEPEPTNEEKAGMIDTLDFLRVEAAQYRLEGVDDLPPKHLKNIKKIEDCILRAEPEPVTEKEET